MLSSQRTPSTVDMTAVTVDEPCLPSGFDLDLSCTSLGATATCTAAEPTRSCVATNHSYVPSTTTVSANYSTSHSTQASSIKTLSPYTPSLSSTVSTFSTLKPRPANISHSTGKPTSKFDSLYGPQTWTKFFTVPSNSSLAANDLNFHLCLLNQVGPDVLFTSRSDGSRQVVVQSASQADAVTHLLDSSGQRILVEKDIFLNSSVGTILVPPFLNVGEQEWSDCADTLKDILTLQNFTVHSVSCYTLPISPK